LRNWIKAVLMTAALAVRSPVEAAMIPDGSVNVFTLTPASADLSSVPNTFSANSLGVIQLNSFGGLGNIDLLHGVINGSISFAPTVGTVIPQSVADFLLLDDGHGGNFRFSVSSVRTVTYWPSPVNAVQLYLTGTTRDAELGYDSTPSWMDLFFSRISGNSYHSSGHFWTHTPDVPEPTSWAMMVCGFGLSGISLRLRKRTIAARCC
jgi:hypothetical protein